MTTEISSREIQGYVSHAKPRLLALAEETATLLLKSQSQRSAGDTLRTQLRNLLAAANGSDLPAELRAFIRYQGSKSRQYLPPDLVKRLEKDIEAILELDKSQSSLSGIHQHSELDQRRVLMAFLRHYLGYLIWAQRWAAFESSPAAERRP